MFISISAYATSLSNRLLAKLAVDLDLPNYSKIAERAGGPNMEKSLSIMILVYMAGSCIGY